MNHQIQAKATRKKLSSGPCKYIKCSFYCKRRGGALHSTCKDSGNHKYTSSLSGLLGRYGYQLLKICWSSASEGRGQEKYFKSLFWILWGANKGKPVQEKYDLSLYNSLRTRVEVFWISWRLYRELFGHPDNSELQESIQEVTHADISPFARPEPLTKQEPPSKMHRPAQVTRIPKSNNKTRQQTTESISHPDTDNMYR